MNIKRAREKRVSSGTRGKRGAEEHYCGCWGAQLQHYYTDRPGFVLATFFTNENSIHQSKLLQTDGQTSSLHVYRLNFKKTHTVPRQTNHKQTTSNKRYSYDIFNSYIQSISRDPNIIPASSFSPSSFTDCTVLSKKNTIWFNPSLSPIDLVNFVICRTVTYLKVALVVIVQ